MNFNSIDAALIHFAFVNLSVCLHFATNLLAALVQTEA
jgi:hypothetical protein